MYRNTRRLDAPGQSGVVQTDGMSPTFTVTMRFKALLSGLLAVAVTSCADGPTTPRALPDVAVVDQVQWSGSLVTLRSDSFRDGGSVRVVMTSDTIATGPGTNADELQFRLPPLMTGGYEARVLTNGGSVPIFVEVVGLAREPIPFAGGFFSVIVQNVQIAGRKAYLAEPFGRFFGPDEEGAYAVVDVVTPAKASQLPALTSDGMNEIKMTVPGPSYRANHLVFDFSAEGSSDVRVWRLTPTLEPVTTLPCGWDPGIGGYHYTAAEVSPGTCLVIRHDEVWRNGTQRLIGDPAFERAQFRIGPDGNRTVLLTRPLFIEVPLESWPVFDASGQIAYTTTRYDAIRGAAFSRDGARLWVVARDRAGDWVLDELDASTGDVVRTLDFPDADLLLDVLLHPLDGRLYVASRDEGRALRPPTLHVIDPGTLELARSVPAPGVASSFASIAFGGVLAAGGSAGRVHVLGRAGVDAGWWIWSFDRL